LNWQRGREKYTPEEAEESRQHETRVRRMGRRVTHTGQTEIPSRNREVQHEDKHCFNSRVQKKGKL